MMIVAFMTLLFVRGYAQANFEYAAACLPTSYDTHDNYCHMSILSNSTANIEISTVDWNLKFTLQPGELYRQELDVDCHPVSGLENKAIRIFSDTEIQVLVFKNSSQTLYSEVYMVPNHIKEGNKYFTTAHALVPNSVCNDYYRQFYLVTSFYDGTFVNITERDGTRYELELPAFGTFVQTTKDRYEDLAVGTEITSSDEVNVISGNLCATNRYDNSEGSRGIYVSSIPPTASIGRNYAIPRILGSGDAAGYSVSVVATEDDTVVESEGQVESIDQGETAVFDYPSWDQNIFINCTKNCLVAQYTKYVFDVYGNFMHHILPETDFYTSAFFATLDANPISYISLVVVGESPGYDIFLNGEALDDVTWTPFHGYSTAQLQIDEGVYTLESSEGRPFAAYVYSHLMYFTAGAGYTLLPYVSSIQTTTSSTTSTPTTPSPSWNSTLPQHTARVNGSAHTEDGQDMTPQCAAAHLSNLDIKATGMIVEVNRAIGESICMNSSDVLVGSSTVAMLVEGNQAFLEVDHTFRVQGHHNAEDVETCALEVASYLSDLSNWPRPIFPDEEGCSRLEMMPEYFNISGTLWNCDNQDLEEIDFSLNYLSYVSDVSETFSTEDGSSLDGDCTRSYTDEAVTKTSSMMNEISTALATSQCDEIVTSATQTQSFIGMGNQAFFTASFIYVPSSTATFNEFLACMQLVHEFSLEHENWSPGSQPGAPFLPVPPGCPALEHDGPTLDDEGQSWKCV